MRGAGDMHAKAKVARYRQLLFRHLADRPAGEVAFFINDRRFDILRPTLGRHLKGAKVLNVGSGPFALEFYVAPPVRRIDSLDLDPALPALHADLRAAGLIGDSRFTLCDAMAFATADRYDVIVINDLFYSKHVDFFAVLSKYTAFLEPGGRLYFDVLDRRAGPIWALFNRDSRYRRYELDKVRTALVRQGFAVEAVVPSLGIKGGLDGLARRLLWTAGGIANNVIFMARQVSVRLGVLVLSLAAGDCVLQ